jgi:hypothetical protein
VSVQQRRGLGPGAGPGPGQGICCSPRTSLPTVTILPCMFLLLVAFEHDPARRQEATMGLAQLCTCINAARSSATRQISCTLPGPTRAHPAKWPLPLSPALLPAAPQRQLQCSAHIAPAGARSGKPRKIPLVSMVLRRSHPQHPRTCCRLSTRELVGDRLSP